MYLKTRVIATNFADNSARHILCTTMLPGVVVFGIQRRINTQCVHQVLLVAEFKTGEINMK